MPAGKLTGKVWKKKQATETVQPMATPPIQGDDNRDETGKTEWKKYVTTAIRLSIFLNLSTLRQSIFVQ